MNCFIKRKLHVLLLFLLSAVVGLFAGSICALFGRVLLLITSFRYNHPFQLIPFLAFGGYAIVFMYQKWGKNSMRGMSLVFAAEFGEEKTIPARMIPFSIIATWITHLFGGSAGREGVAVQIGSTIGFRIGKLFNDYRISRILLIAGIAGGFGGLFRTPLAAVFFSLEVLIAGRLTYEALVPSVIAAATASLVSGFLGIVPETVVLTASVQFTPVITFKIIVLAFLFGIAGQIFAVSINSLRAGFPKFIPDARIRVLAVGASVSIFSLLLFKGRYSGLGLNLSKEVFTGGTVYPWDWIVKMAFTVVCLSSGFQGGELTPLFVIGSTLGMTLAPFMGLPPTFCAALGYAAVFSSATNTFLTPVTIACEIFGFTYMPFFFLVCAIAYAFNGHRSIYCNQKLVTMQFPE
jgi:H+/Cl- antiporter ClcA